MWADSGHILGDPLGPALAVSPNAPDVAQTLHLPHSTPSWTSASLLSEDEELDLVRGGGFDLLLWPLAGRFLAPEDDEDLDSLLLPLASRRANRF